jgi:hypothetical protein
MLTAEGAIAGAIGMIFYCIVATPAIERFKALKGSIFALSGWLLISAVSFACISLGMRW